jgi:clan AA aspartic protease
MGFTYVKVKVANPLTPEKSEEVNLLVDSGAVFTSISSDVLERLDLKPVDREKLRVYGGAIVERKVGWALIEYGGKRRVVPVIFGEKEDASILGATSLESLGFQVDPVTKKLKSTEFLMI